MDHIQIRIAGYDHSLWTESLLASIRTMDPGAHIGNIDGAGLAPPDVVLLAVTESAPIIVEIVEYCLDWVRQKQHTYVRIIIKGDSGDEVLDCDTGNLASELHVNTERIGIVREILCEAKIRLPLVEEYVAGVTLPSTYVVYIREEHDFVMDLLDGRIDTSNVFRAERYSLTYWHEVVHFTQGVTLSLPHNVGMNFLRFSLDLSKVARAGQLTPQLLNEHFRDNFHKLLRLLNDDVNGVSAMTLMEAQAVTEAYRTVYPEAGSDEFFVHLDKYFGTASSSPYRQVIDIVAQTLGQEAAYHFTPILSFAALQGDKAAENFWSYLAHVFSTRGGRWEDITPRKLLEERGLAPEGTLLARFPEIPIHLRHPLLYEYLEYLHTRGTLDELIDFSAKPGIGFRNPHWLGDFQAPFVLDDTAAIPRGLAYHWDDNKSFSYLAMASLVGVLTRMVYSEYPYMPCLHRNCPVHSTALCHMTIPPSIKKRWQDCMFHTILGEVYRSSADHLLAIRSEADRLESTKQ